MTPIFNDEGLDLFIKENYLVFPVKTLARKVGKSSTYIYTRLKCLNLVIPQELIEERKKNGRFKIGNTLNKGKKVSPEVYAKMKNTFFKKGSIAHNSLPIGAEIKRVDKKNNKSYFMIKIESKRKLVFKHIHIWTLANGAPKKGENVVFKDGNTLNCKIENLELITDQELMVRNSLNQWPSDLQEVIKLTNKLKNKINEKQK